jgi:hypothetical protein
MNKQEEQPSCDKQGEPVAEVILWRGEKIVQWEQSLPVGTKFYTTPPQSEARGLSQQRKPLTNEQKFALVEKCLGLKKRTEDTVIDRYTGLFTDSARYFVLIDAAYNFKE